jgi:predicted RND superfamily exporter protein
VTIASAGRITRRLVGISCWRPWLTIAVAAGLAVLAAAYTLHGLRFRPDTLDLLPRDAPFVERWRAYERAFAAPDEMVVVVEAPSLEAAAAYAERLRGALARSPVPFPRVAYGVDVAGLEGRGLLYLSADELRQLRRLLAGDAGLLARFAASPDLVGLVEGISAEAAGAIAAGFAAPLLDDDGPRLDPALLEVLLEQIDGRLGPAPPPYRSPWRALLPAAEPDAATTYVTSDDGRLLFVLVEPPPGDLRSFTTDRAAMEAIRGAIEALRPDFPGVRAGVTGGAALGHDEMTTAFEDSSRAVLLAFALILAVMALAFRRLAKPAVMEREVRAGRPLREALGATAEHTGPVVVLSALTAGATFYVLGLTDFPGIQELGVIAGTAILLACLGMLTVLPALLVLIDRRREGAPAAAPAARALGRLHVLLIARLPRRPRSVLAAATLATIVAAVAVPFVGLDYNLLNLQAPDTESVVWQRRLQAGDWRRGMHGLTTAGSRQELERLAAAFRRLPTVHEVESLLDVVPAQQEEKLAILRGLAPAVERVRVGRPAPVDPAHLARALGELARRLAVIGDEAPADVAPELQASAATAGRALERLRAMPPGQARAALEALQAELAQDFAATLVELRTQLPASPVRLEDVPEDLRRRYVGTDGRFALLIHPRVDVWEREGAAAFVGDLRSVDPTVTGPAVITYEAIGLMERAYLQGSLYAYAVVTALALAMIRRVRETVLALLPLVLGMVWTLGLMHVFGLTFTLANVFALPFLVGACAEFGLSLVLSHLEERGRGGPLVARAASTGVMVNGLTTMVGFGSLMIARHQGIFGLGLLLTLGAAARLVATLAVVPAILRVWPAPRRRAPGAARSPDRR